MNELTMLMPQRTSVNNFCLAVRRETTSQNVALAQGHFVQG